VEIKLRVEQKLAEVRDKGEVPTMAGVMGDSGVLSPVVSTDNDDPLLVLAVDNMEGEEVFAQSVLRIDHREQEAQAIEGLACSYQGLGWVLGQLALQAQVGFGQHGIRELPGDELSPDPGGDFDTEGHGSRSLPTLLVVLHPAQPFLPADPSYLGKGVR